MYSFIYFSILVFTKFMKVNAEVGVCNIQSQLQYSAVKQLASDYQKVKAQVTTALMTAGESEGFILFFKVHIFWEGHKILWNLHQLFVLCTASQIIGGDFAKFCGLLRIYELYHPAKNPKIWIFFYCAQWKNSNFQIFLNYFCFTGRTRSR